MCEWEGSSSCIYNRKEEDVPPIVILSVSHCMVRLRFCFPHPNAVLSFIVEHH
jgi:hypothetical protein